MQAARHLLFFSALRQRLFAGRPPITRLKPTAIAPAVSNNSLVPSVVTRESISQTTYVVAPASTDASMSAWMDPSSSPECRSISLLNVPLGEFNTHIATLKGARSGFFLYATPDVVSYHAEMEGDRVWVPKLTTTGKLFQNFDSAMSTAKRIENLLTTHHSSHFVESKVNYSHGEETGGYSGYLVVVYTEQGRVKMYAIAK